MSFRKLLVLAGLALVPLAPLTASCSAEVLPPKGQLMLVITTNLAPPKDFDTVHVRVIEEGANAPVLDVDYALTGSQAIKLPATLGIVAGSDPNKIVRVTVEGRKGATVRVQRHATSRVPQNRIAALQLPIDGLCLDQAACPGGTADELQTCIVGSCQSAKVEVDDLPTFSTAAVFGGAEGTCFDTLGCFAAGRSAVLRSGDCSLDKEPGAGFNLAVLRERQTNEGICGSNACLLPLDKDPFNGPVVTGWREAAGRVVVPRAVCDRALPIMLTTVCPTKNAPTCGPWSALGSGSGLAADASVPIGDATFPETGGEGGVSPTTPSSIKFEDQDPEKFSIAGTVTIGRAANESSLKAYELYWGDGPSKKLDRIVRLPIPSNDGALVHALTGKPPGDATHLIVFGANDAGPVGAGVAVGPIDNHAQFINPNVNGPDIDHPIALMDPTGTAVMVVGFDKASGRNRPALLRCKFDGTGCSYSDLLAAGQAPGTGTEWMLGAAIDPVGKELFIASDTTAAGSGLAFTRCDRFGAGCKVVTVPAPAGTTPYGEPSGCHIPVLVDSATSELVMVRTWSGDQTYVHRCSFDGTRCTAHKTNVAPAGGCNVAFLRPAESKILVVQLAGNINPRLIRCSYDATSCNEELLSPGTMGRFSAAIDENEKKLLIVGIHSGDSSRFTRIRCNLDGTGCEAKPLGTVDDTQPFEPSLVIDAVHQSMFAFGQTSNSQGKYFRCKSDGTACIAVVTNPQLVTGGRNPNTLIHEGKIFSVSTGLAPGTLQIAFFNSF